MNKIRRIDVRVTQKQYEMIQNKKENEGYTSLSDFIRASLLKEDLETKILLRKIDAKLTKSMMKNNK